MPHFTKTCDGDDCMPGDYIPLDTKIWSATTFAEAHGLPTPYSSSRPDHTAIVTRTVRIWTSIQSKPGCWNHNPAAIQDLRLLSTDKKTKEDLAKRGNIIIIITDVPNIDNYLKGYFQGAHATVCIIRPTRRHVEFSVRYATGVLRPGDECTMWFGCFAKPGENAFQLVDSSALITGTVSSIPLAHINHTNMLPRRNCFIG
ncbi:hypothetical protein FRB93_007072 [Tulasnella sp. JGI-2019a]|nr:hypothetical protein FRB93_007072 [Tulasnella sp. JGI-2019a]